MGYISVTCILLQYVYNSVNLQRFCIATHECPIDSPPSNTMHAAAPGFYRAYRRNVRLEFEELAVLCLALYRVMSGNQLAAYVFHHIFVVTKRPRLNCELQSYMLSVLNWVGYTIQTVTYVLVVDSVDIVLPQKKKA